MMMVYVLVIASFLVGFIFAQKRKYKGDLFCKIAQLLLDLFSRIVKRKGEDIRIQEDIKVLFPNVFIKNKVKEFHIKRIKIILIIIFVGNLFSLYIQVMSNRESSIVNSHFIERNAYGKGIRTETIIAQIEGEQIEESIEVTLSEQQFLQEEIYKVFQESKREVEQEFLGENQSVDNIDQKVNLVNTIKKGLINVEWEITPFGLIDYSGEILKKNISQEGELGKVTACLKYFDYEYYDTFYIKIFPKTLENQEGLTQGLKNQIEEKEKETLTQPRLELPKSINNQSIKWKSQKQFKGLWMLLLTIVMSIGVGLKKKRDLKDQVKKREQQMLVDYSQVVGKLMLFLGAGMPVSQAWKRLALDYKKQRQVDNIPLRYIYEEMLLTYYEISDGIPEIEALERFGRRCRVQKYSKLSGVLIQNIRQGTKEIKRILQYEMKDAMEVRKSMAKKLGEEAGTKLLGPMMILLIVILVMIAVPAFWAL